MSFKRILVIADQTRARNLALPRAVKLAAATGAAIDLVGFCYDPSLDAMPAEGAAIERGRRTLLAATHARLDEMLAGTDLQRVNATHRTVWCKWIHEWVVAQHGDYDLVVKTAHRSATMFYTSTDWHLLRTSPIPLMLVGSRTWKKRAPILATVDLQSTKAKQRKLNSRVLELATAVATALDCPLHVVYALPVPPVLKELEIVEPRAEVRKFRRGRRALLRDLAACYSIDPGRIHLLAGAPENVIPTVARRLKAQLVVMGTIGRHGLKGILIGNTAEQVLQRLPADVLAVRPE